jgi:hypothetical protein
VLITLEGVDGSGKSTLAADLVAEIQREYPDDEVHLLHAGPLKTDPYTAYVEPIEDYVPNSGVHYVLDRWHVGEIIYGPLYRGMSAIDGTLYARLENAFFKSGMATFHVTQPLDEIRRRLEARGEDFLQDEHVEQVWQAFYDVLNPLDFATFVGRVEPRGSNDLLVDSIIAYARALELRASLATDLL